MAWVERRVTRTTQPQDAVGVDWNNPLARGLVTVAVPGVFGLNVPTTPGSLGVSPSLATLSSVAVPALKTASLTTLSVRKSNTSQFRNNFTASVATFLGSNLGFGHGTLEYSNNRTLTTNCFTQAGVDLKTNSAASILSVPAGQKICLTTTLVAGLADGHRLYNDGSLVASGSTTGMSGSDTTRSGFLTFNNANGGSTQFDLPTVFVVVHNRVLSDAEIKSLSENPWQVFEPEVQRVWVDDFVSAGGGVTLTPPLLTNASTLFSPSLNTGSIAVQPPLLTNASTLFSPSLNTGSIAVQPPLLTNASTLFSPLVSAGGFILQTPLFENVNEFFSHTLTPGAIELAPPLLPSSNTFFEPSVGTNLGVPLLIGSSTLFAPALALGAIEIAPPLLPSSNAFFVHAVSIDGAIALAPPLLVNVSNLYTPSVGAASIYPPPSAVLYGTWYGPTGMEFMGTLIPHALTPTILGPTEVVAFWPETTVVAFDQPIVVTMVPNT